MGIRYLNKYLVERCSNTSIKQIHLSKLKDKTIVIDTSIYLYKFIGDGLLEENLYILITTLKKYNINALFVFDGVPPQEKWNTIESRNKEKDHAEVMYDNLTHKLSISQYNDDERKKIISQMHSVRKQCVRIKKHQITFAKKIMEVLGIKYIDAIGEADEICAKLCKSKIAFGCLSDDMDMFTYGCSNILRNLNLLKEEVTIYNYESILTDLQLTSTTFRILLIISTNDYNDQDDNNFNKSIKLYNDFKSTDHTNISFKTWLEGHAHDGSNTKDINHYERIYNLDNYIDVNVNNLNETSCKEDKIKYYNELQQIMKPHGFIFLNN